MARYSATQKRIDRLKAKLRNHLHASGALTLYDLVGWEGITFWQAKQLIDELRAEGAVRRYKRGRRWEFSLSEPTDRG